MRTVKFLLVIFLVFVVIPSAKAQLVIQSNGRVVVGSNNRPDDDRDTVLSMSIQGKHGEYNAGSKLAFGDFGRFNHNGWNVFVGEYGTYDSDMLWLHGKKGIKTTTLNSSYVVSEWNYEVGHLPRFTIYDGLRVDRMAVSSDDSHKNSVETIDFALPRLLRLQGVSYTYQPIENLHPVGDIGGTDDSDGLSAKDSIGKNQYKSILKEREKGDKRYGFMTAELIRHFPEIVEVDTLGNEYINYIEMIPILVSAIGELCAEIENNGIRLDVIDSYSLLSNDSISNLSTRSARRISRNAREVDDAILYQNTPNPFTIQTVIDYYVPENSINACLYIFNLTGDLLQTYPITQMGNGQVTINASTLNAGMYLYSLVVGDQIIDTKRMILTK